MPRCIAGDKYVARFHFGLLSRCKPRQHSRRPITQVPCGTYGSNACMRSKARHREGVAWHREESARASALTYGLQVGLIRLIVQYTVEGIDFGVTIPAGAMIVLPPTCADAGVGEVSARKPVSQACGLAILRRWFPRRRLKGATLGNELSVVRAAAAVVAGSVLVCIVRAMGNHEVIVGLHLCQV